jgi:hypothetical protein
MRLSQMKTVRDVGTRFRENWKGYLRQYRVLLVLTLLASLADMASTIQFMLAHGPGLEGHPFIRMLSELLGPVLGPLVGKGIQLLVAIGLTVFLRRWAAYIFIAVIILYAWAAWYNIWGHDLYYPRLLQILQRLGL